MKIHGRYQSRMENNERGMTCNVRYVCEPRIASCELRVANCTLRDEKKETFVVDQKLSLVDEKDQPRRRHLLFLNDAFGVYPANTHIDSEMNE